MQLKEKTVELPASWEILLKNNDAIDLGQREVAEIVNYMRRNFKDYYVTEVSKGSSLGRFQGVVQDLKTFKIYTVVGDYMWKGAYNSTRYTVKK